MARAILAPHQLALRADSCNGVSAHQSPFAAVEKLEAIEDGLHLGHADGWRVVRQADGGEQAGMHGNMEGEFFGCEAVLGCGELALDGGREGAVSGEADIAN